MSKTDKKIKEFIDNAMEIYADLSSSFVVELTYKMLIEESAKKTYGKNHKKSRIGQCYGYLRNFYLNHPYIIDNYGKSDLTDKRVTLNDISDLFDHLLEGKDLRNVFIEANYRYYTFEQKVRYNNKLDTKRIFLVLETDDDAAKNVFKVLKKPVYSELYESMYLGFCGVIIIFSCTGHIKTFISYLKGK